jgi:hypothetical protein
MILCLSPPGLGKTHPALYRASELNDNDKHRRVKVLAARGHGHAKSGQSWPQSGSRSNLICSSIPVTLVDDSGTSLLRNNLFGSWRRSL